MVQYFARLLFFVNFGVATFLQNQIEIFLFPLSIKNNNLNNESCSNDATIANSLQNY